MISFYEELLPVHSLSIVADFRQDSKKQVHCQY